MLQRGRPLSPPLGALAAVADSGTTAARAPPPAFALPRLSTGRRMQPCQEQSRAVKSSQEQTRAVKSRLKPQAELPARSDGRDRCPRLTAPEKPLAAQAALESQGSGAPLAKRCLQDAARAWAEALPRAGRHSMQLQGNRPEEGWASPPL